MQPFTVDLFSEGSKNVFVFESDKSGRNLSVTAQFAIKHCGAEKGQVQGWRRNSYALVTFEPSGKRVSIDELASQIRQLYHFSNNNTGLQFFVPKIGCGVLGYSETQVASLFSGFGSAFVLPSSWKVL